MMATIQTDSHQDISGYRMRLKKISDDLGKRDVAGLKFLCSDLIPISKLEKINNGIAIMQELENCRMIYPSNCQLLAELLFRVGRKDIVKRHMGIDPMIVQQRIHPASDQESVLSPFRILLHKIAEEIPQTNLGTLKFLFEADFSARSRELATDVYGFFKLLEAQEMITEDNIDKLYEIMEAIKRNDLMDHLNEYKTKKGGTFGSPRFTPHIPKYEDDFMKKHEQPYLARELLGQQSYDRRQTECQGSNQVGSVTERDVGIQPVQRTNERQIKGRTSPEQNFSTPVQVSDDNTSPMQIAGAETSAHPSMNMAALRGAHQYHHGGPRSESLIVETSGGLEQAELMEDHKTWQDTARIQQQARGHGCRDSRPEPNYQPRTSDDLPEYKMSSNPRGYCLIINNEFFQHTPNDDTTKKLDNRPGTKKDQENLEQLFGRLGFNVIVHQNLQVDKMKKTFNRVSKLDHKDKDALVVCVLSHGAIGCVYGTDGRQLSISRILRQFNVTECPHLAGKPKIFYIAACQGTDKSATASKIQKDGHVTTETANDADFLVGFATIPGFVSYRHEDDGTWYIQTLVQKLQQHSSRHDLLSIMTDVSHGVLEHSAPGNHGKTYKQVPLPYTTLTKKVYLRPF